VAQYARPDAPRVEERNLDCIVATAAHSGRVIAGGTHSRERPAYTRDTRGLRQPGVRIKIRPDWSYIRDVDAKAF
jgi:hypothetical protein